MERKNPIWTPSDIVTASAAEARRSAKPKSGRTDIPAKRQTAGIGQATVTARFRALPAETGRRGLSSQPETAGAESRPPLPSSRSKEEVGGTLTAIEVGARAIYEFRSHPKKRPWDAISEEERASYRERMKQLHSAINDAGFQIRRG